MTPRNLVLVLPVLLLAISANAAESTDRPNILLIVADDLGYADLGVYGGDISTPNIDTLAREGMLFTQFHTAPLCEPTRAMLLSGNNNHVAGVAAQGVTGVAGHPLPGYENHLSDRIVPFPRLLRDSGYHTYTIGKWHLGLEQEHWPIAAGFERSFSLLQGGGSYFDTRSFRPSGSIYVADDALAVYPDGEYATDVYTDKLIGFIDENKDDGEPFFAFAAYTSPHWPLQLPDDDLDLYAGQYDDGYDVLRERRFDSLKEAGIIPLDSSLPPRNDEITPWTDLSRDEQRRESRKMELYAGMVHNLDEHIGRLIAYLKDNGLYENTLVVFMADNGAAAEDFYNGVVHEQFMEHTRSIFDNAYEKMGTADSFVSYGAQWAQAGSAPFRRHKGFTTEGGIVAPMIMTGVGVAAKGVIDRSYATVMDFAPTFLEIAGAEYPDDGSVMPMLGESMVEFIGGRAESIHDDDYVTVLSHRGRAYLRQGQWKIVTQDAPFEESRFELFDLGRDPGEANNLANDEPEKLEELIALWRIKRRELGIVLPQDL